MRTSILITQALQNDFVKPIGRYDPLPNDLHVGFSEARRLNGDDPREGPVSLTMKWAYSLPPEELAIIHLRDWHDPADPDQAQHFLQFGSHCVAGSEGAEFAFEVDDPGRPVTVINSPSLNDFVGSPLAEVLAPLVADGTRVGLMGVWTEAKVFFLAYELRTRYPGLDLAVCSALTASSSRSRHFLALEQY
ncbi:MAG: cysteine hydrolase family protein [Promethearchaeota archaeon]